MPSAKPAPADTGTGSVNVSLPNRGGEEMHIWRNRRKTAAPDNKFLR
jgi:hypothetical protein